MSGSRGGAEARRSKRGLAFAVLDMNETAIAVGALSGFLRIIPKLGVNDVTESHSMMVALEKRLRKRLIKAGVEC